ncbi:Pentatricopeptide repeat-containing protein [Dichanthelium oligosanthes]|uniref:Pentatricopeptide repeat-containing protein n=1 Tax=Dichanthelium oligosanthes TaxID=888268 RepID=A0A1E5UTW1_9POAL|nr:Pentatricopeptide repeat-containing protein [Dichanthelium oligosanthes]
MPSDPARRAALLPPNLPPHIPYSRALQQRLYLIAQHLSRRAGSPSASPSAARRGLDQLHAQLLLNGFTRKRFLLAKLLSLATAAADLPRAESLFLSASPHHPTASPTLANLLLRAAAVSRATPLALLALFSRLVGRHGLRPNAFSFSTLLAALASLGAGALPHGRALHARALAGGALTPSGENGHVMTSLVDMYASARQLGDARKMFDEMRAKSVAAWNCMLAAYVRCGELDAALRFFGHEMPYRDAVAWTTVIGGCANSGRATEAVELFMGMRKARVKDDAVTMIALLTACAELGDLELGRWVHARVDWEGQRGTVLLDNALIHMYVKCGAVEDALRLFLMMPKRSTISWTTMISGLAMNGRAQEALDLFHRMQERPDGATLLAVLRTCSHAGRIDDALRYFESMERVYGITPEKQHYGCMVDMLCRWRQLHEALELVEKMPFQPNEGAWGAILSGCRREGNLELAAKVTDRLVELQPERAAGHLVLLSNMYAGVGQWEQARMVRERVAALNAEKPAGRSWVNQNESSMVVA